MLPQVSHGLKFIGRSCGTLNGRGELAQQAGKSQTKLQARRSLAIVNRFLRQGRNTINLNARTSLRSFCNETVAPVEPTVAKSAAPAAPRTSKAENKSIESYNKTMSMQVSREEYSRTVKLYYTITTEGDPPLEPNGQTFCLITTAFLALRQSAEADEVYEKARNAGFLNVALANVHLQHWVTKKDMAKVEETWLRMEMDNIEPDELSYVLKMKLHFHVSDMRGFNETWSELRTKRPELVTSASINLAAISLAHSKDLDRLQPLLVDVTNKYINIPSACLNDPGIYETILLNYGFHGDYTKVEKMLQGLMESNVRITNAHCVAVLIGMCAASRVNLAEKFVYYYVRKDLIRNRKAMDINLSMLNRLLLAECIHVRDVSVATRTYSAILRSGVIAGDLLPFETNCMVRIHLDRGEEELANKYFEQYLRSVPASEPFPLPLDLMRIYINHFIEAKEVDKVARFWAKYGDQMAEGTDQMRLALEVHATTGDTKSARAIFDKILASGSVPTAEMCQAVIRTYIAANDPKRAISMFEETQENGIAPTAGSYNLIVGIYASRGDTNKVTAAIETMIKDGVSPTADTYGQLMNVHMFNRKWESAIQVFETHFQVFPDNTPSLESNNSSVLASEKKTVDGENENSKTDSQKSNTATLLKPSVGEFCSALLAASNANDKKRISDYWSAMKAHDGVMTIDHFFAVLGPAGSQTPLFISILQHLQKRIIKPSFHVSLDQSKQLAKIIRTNLVSQSSPLWPLLEPFALSQGRSQLNWDKRKDWTTILAKAIYEYTSQNPS